MTRGKSEHKFKLQQIPIKIPIKIPILKREQITDTENDLIRICHIEYIDILVFFCIRPSEIEHRIEVSMSSGGGGVELNSNVITPEPPSWYHP